MATKYKGITVQIGGDTTGLDKALAGVNKEARDIQKELREVNKALKLDPENAELMVRKQKLLALEVENTANKLKVMEQVQEQVNEQFKKGEIGELQYLQFQGEIDKTKAKLEQFNGSAKKVTKASEEMDKSLTDSGKAGKKMGSDIASGAQQAESEIKDVSQSSAKLENQFKTLIKAVASGYTGKKLIDYFIGSNMKMEQYITSFTTMLGSAEKAKALMDDINEMAAKTPFETTDLTKAAQMLMNYGVAEDEVINKMTQLGDLSGGVAEKLDRVALAYGQMLAKGKVTGEELRQMTEAGVTLLQPLANELGVTTAELQKMVSAGKVGIPELNAAIEKMTSEGGKFSGMMENQAHTMSGMLSTLKDEFTQFGREAGEKAFGEVKGALQEVMATIEQASSDGTLDQMAEELGNALNVLVTSLMNVAKFLWEYRDAVAAGAAAMVTFNALMKISNLVRDLSLAYKTLTGSLEAVTAAQTATNVAMAANPVGLVISAVGALIAILGTLAATADSAHDKTMAAISEYENIKSEVEDLNEELKQNKLRIIEIQEQGSISTIDPGEIDRLKEANSQLEILIKQKEIAADSARKEADREAIKELDKKNDTLRNHLGDYYKAKQNYEEAVAELENTSEEDKEAWLNVIERYKKAMDEEESEVVKLWAELGASREALLQESAASKEEAEEYDALTDEIINEFDVAGEKLTESVRKYGDSLLDGLANQSTSLAGYHKDMLEQELNDLKDQRTLGLIEDREYYKKAEKLLIQHDNDMYGEHKELWGEINKSNKQESQKLLDEQKKANEKVKNEQEKAAKASADAWKKEFDVVIDSGKKAAEEVIRQQEELENKLRGNVELYRVDEDGELIVNSLSEQTEAIRKYKAIIDELKYQGVSDNFMEQFLQYDMDEATAFGEALLSDTDMMREYLSEWEEQQSEIAAISKDVYNNAADEVNSEFTEKIQNKLNEMPEFARTLGEDTAEEYLEGVKSGMSELEELLNEASTASVNATYRAPKAGNKPRLNLTQDGAGTEPQYVGAGAVPFLPSGKIVFMVGNKTVGEIATDEINERIAQGEEVFLL